MHYTYRATQKATLFTALCSIFFVVRWQLMGAALPIGLLEALILLNTFFSIRIFASITPAEDLLQVVMDFLLAASYVAMIFFLYDAQLYLFLGIVMFALATIKYVLLRRENPHQNLLRHKISIDLCGTLGFAVAFVASILFPNTQAVLWVWALVFAIAQIDVFFLNPLYTFHREV